MMARNIRNKSRRYLRKTIKRKTKYGGKRNTKRGRGKTQRIQRGGFIKRLGNALTGGFTGLINGALTDSRIYRAPGFQGGSYKTEREIMLEQNSDINVNSEKNRQNANSNNATSNNATSNNATSNNATSNNANSNNANANSNNANANSNNANANSNNANENMSGGSKSRSNKRRRRRCPCDQSGGKRKYKKTLKNKRNRRR